MDPLAYLQRIRVDPRETGPTARVLAALQLAHLCAVPFENLDILWPRPLRLDRRTFYRKIVAEGRGGICYELNGLFAWLLGRLGFAAHIVSARAYRPAGVLRSEYDHMAIVVRLDGRPLLVDVGFGGAQPRQPLPLDGTTSAGPEGAHRVRQVDEDRFELEHRLDQGWLGVYQFTTRPCRLGAFRQMYRHHRFDADAPFTGRCLCSLAMPEGRVVLTDSSLVTTTTGGKQRLAVTTADQWLDLLENRFGIQPPAAAGSCPAPTPPVLSAAGERNPSGSPRGAR